MGYGHIASAQAEKIAEFYCGYFNPYLNFHRPCGVPEWKVDRKGKSKRVYRCYATPWEILRQLPGVASALKPGVTIEQLERTAQGKSDTEAALEMQKAKQELFASFAQKRIA
jgi:hypothetical protein